MAIFGYIRVSTNKQNMESQKYEILKYCYKNNLEVTDWIEENNVNPSTLYEFIRVELEGRPDYKEKYKT